MNKSAQKIKRFLVKKKRRGTEYQKKRIGFPFSRKSFLLYFSLRKKKREHLFCNNYYWFFLPKKHQLNIVGVLCGSSLSTTVQIELRALLQISTKSLDFEIKTLFNRPFGAAYFSRQNGFKYHRTPPRTKEVFSAVRMDLKIAEHHLTLE